jgi:predicted Zn-ribbon and HTH transcriptional regulator
MNAENPRHCRHCGFSLEGVSYRTACPGCGAPVIGLLEPEHPPIFNLPPREDPLPTGPVQTDEACLNCGYGLRGLNAGGNCPECGTPVMQSLMGKFLRFASAEHLAALHRGARWVLWSLVLRGLIVVLGIALAALAPGTSEGGVMILGMLAVGSSTYGWLLLTREHVLVARWHSRHWARWLTVGANAVELLGYTSWAGQSPSPSSFMRGLLPGAPCLYGVGFGIVWVLSITLAMVYMTRLAWNMPEPRLAPLCTVAAWLTPLLVIGSAVLGLACPLVPLGGWLAAYVYYIVVIDRCRATLWRLRAEAEHRELAAGYIRHG